MNPEKDYYAVLGIMPDAEVVVVIAAYRALASLYHPDKWKGDVTEATRRMAEINVAYGVLGDAAKRKQYDASRKTSHSSFDAEDEQRDEAFDSALSELEERWQIAVEIFPDLREMRQRLAKTAHRLAFAFVTVMLETKQFNQRVQVSEAMENSFLQQYFGTNPAILAFVKRLVITGQRDAVKAVNRYVDVLGPDVPPHMIIGKVAKEFRQDADLTSIRKEFRSALNTGDKYGQGLASVRLLQAMGYQSQLVGGGIRVLLAGSEIAAFETENQLVDWLIAQNFQTDL